MRIETVNSKGCTSRHNHARANFATFVSGTTPNVASWSPGRSCKCIRRLPTPTNTTRVSQAHARANDTAPGPLPPEVPPLATPWDSQDRHGFCLLRDLISRSSLWGVLFTGPPNTYDQANEPLKENPQWSAGFPNGCSSAEGPKPLRQDPHQRALESAKAVTPATREIGAQARPTPNHRKTMADVQGTGRHPLLAPRHPRASPKPVVRHGLSTLTKHLPPFVTVPTHSAFIGVAPATATPIPGTTAEALAPLIPVWTTPDCNVLVAKHEELVVPR